MRQYFYNILLRAEKIVIFSPWIKTKLSQFYKAERNVSVLPIMRRVHALRSLCSLLNQEHGHKDKKMQFIINKFVLLPIVVEQKMLFKSEHNDKFLCIFHMKKEYIKIKNINRVLKAILRLKKKGITINLDIIGDGCYKWKVNKKIERLNLTKEVRLIGKFENKNIVDIISNYKAFVLCSYPETFGMVYIEALSSGLPIIYTKDTGIDGYFNDSDIGLKVNYKSINEIERAFCEINSKFDYYKSRVQILQDNRGLSIFEKEYIKEEVKKVFSEQIKCTEGSIKGGFK